MSEKEKKIGKKPTEIIRLKELSMDLKIFGEDEPEVPKKEVEGGFRFTYTDVELTVLGFGDPQKGLERIYETVMSDPRPMVEKAMDTRRPLQDELDIFFPPLPPERPS